MNIDNKSINRSSEQSKNGMTNSNNSPVYEGLNNTTKGLIKPKLLPPKALQLVGISQRQIKEHYHILYMAYVENLNEIRHQLKNANREGTDSVYSEFRGLKAGETYTLNGIVLHELYFQNLGYFHQRPEGKILQAIEDNFGNYDTLKKDFVATGLSAMGWAVLSYDHRDQMLHNYMIDAENRGAFIYASPLLILDVYEHAYFIDYGARRQPYINAFMRNIDWSVVQSRFRGLEK